ncbi:MAG: hypothetical protein NTV24_00695 [Candidatus Woesebacteria bacterium]|nr:hypothetical protein [Candidatus Woesebacteria bacterium]
MSKRIIFIFVIISFVLTLLIGGGLYWLKKLEKKENGIGSDKIEVSNITCDLNGKTYQQGENFLFRLNSECSNCVCSRNGIVTCEKANCPEGSLNE